MFQKVSADLYVFLKAEAIYLIQREKKLYE